MIYSIGVEFMCYSFRIRSSDIWHVRSVIISIKLSFEIYFLLLSAYQKTVKNNEYIVKPLILLWPLLLLLLLIIIIIIIFIISIIIVIIWLLWLWLWL